MPSVNHKAFLESLEHDEDLMREVYDVYCTDMPVKLAAYESALGAGDLDAAERAAHSIKGASANLYAEDARSAAGTAERACRERDATAARAAAAPLRAALEAVIQEIEA